MLASTRLLGGGIAAALLAAAASAPLPASAAKLCVGGFGCYPTINKAVSQASPGDIISVNNGTYHEDVIIGKPLSLIGTGPGSAVINARGLAIGIYIDGRDNPGLASVTISGFTIEHANFEGILATNASNLTIEGNVVTNNDKSLNFAKSECPGLPTFETSEGDDCGEGIHLMGVDHSIVSDNESAANAGGILLTDETAANHDNLIADNAVESNVWDCGITLASHPPASGSGSPLGIFRNTIFGNNSSGNGTKGMGAGIGLFAFLPGATVAANTVSDNEADGNGIGGIVFHAHAPGANFSNNVVIGNGLAGNGADPDASSSGPNGIVVFGASPISGLVIAKNTIQSEAIDVLVNTPAAVDLHLNNLQAQTGGSIGVQNAGKNAVDATENYWGCSDGPGTSGCSTVSGKVKADPFLTAAVTE